MKTSKDIIQEIRTLLNELENSGSPLLDSHVKSTKVKKEVSIYSGCMGGIMYLVDNTFFSLPKSLVEVMQELQKEGWHYGRSLVSMNLLALTRKRTLTRIKEQKGWKYVVRK